VTTLTTVMIRLTLWQLRVLARLIALLPLPWVLGQDVVELTPEERLRLVAMLGAWTMGRPRRTPSDTPRRQAEPRAGMAGGHGARSKEPERGG
jgi:hypothetical protein